MNATNLTAVPPALGPRRNTRRWLWRVGTAFVAGLLVFLAGLWFSTPAADDPVHEGRHLSEYLAQLRATYTAGDGGYTSFPVNARDINRMSTAEREAYHAQLAQTHEEGERGVRALGARCFPFLLGRIRKEETWRERLVQKTARRLKLRVFPSRTYARRWQSVTALRALKRAGCDVTPLLPAIRDLASSGDRDIRMAARLLLGQWDRASLAELERGEAAGPPRL